MKVFVFLALCIVTVFSTVTFEYDQYSGSPALSRGQGDSTLAFDLNYGSSKLSEEYVSLYTKTMCGSSNEVVFNYVNPGKQSGCNEYTTVRDINGCGLPQQLEAATHAGSRFSSGWGALANGPPGGLSLIHI